MEKTGFCLYCLQEDVVFIVYPIGISDTKNLTPLIRRGITATPLQLDYDGTRTFLIDASVYRGSSGSPVFLYNIGSYHNKFGQQIFQNRMNFLGIIAYMIKDQLEPETQTSNLDSPRSDTKLKPVDLGLVLKSTILMDLIEIFLKKLKASHSKK